MKNFKMMIAAFCMIALVFAGTNLSAQQQFEISIEKEEVTNTRGSNPAIKQDRPVEDKEAPMPRGAYCSVDFDNYTGYYVDVYVDGSYYGTLYPYEKNGSVTVYSGYTTIYCETTGGTYSWSDSGNCDGYYTFSLY